MCAWQYITMDVLMLVASTPVIEEFEFAVPQIHS